MKKVIITGGTGFIGSALAENLIKNQFQVILLSRNPDRAKDVPQGARVEKWDAKTGEGWSSLIDAETTIVNLAGESVGVPPLPWTPARKQRIRDSRLDAANAVVDAVKRAAQKPRVVIQGSAVGYFGTTMGDAVITEDSPQGTDFLARVQIDAGNIAKQVESVGVRLVVIHTGLPMDMREGVLPWLSLPFKFFAGGPLGSGKQYMPWIHLTDYVNAVSFLIEKDDARGAYNLSAPNPVTNREFSRALGRAMHRPSFFPAPAFAFKLVFGEMADLVLLPSWRQVPQRLLEAGFKFQFADVESALKDLFSK